jgi:chromosome segregation ATPase
MANVNTAELRASLKNCVEFCRANDDRDYCQRHLPRLEKALHKLQESRDETDACFTDWREEQRQQKQSWKELARELRQTQEELSRVDASGFPDERVMYWDEEILAEAINRMIDWLKEQGEAIDFAVDTADKLERKLESAQGENEEQEEALRVYRNKVKKRSDSMGRAIQVVVDFRELLRDQLGEEHEDYQSIRWPYALSPDDNFF